eukprot:Filipodium_phascolosomae@DN6789_c0_g1_i1.p1
MHIKAPNLLLIILLSSINAHELAEETETFAAPEDLEHFINPSDKTKQDSVTLESLNDAPQDEVVFDEQLYKSKAEQESIESLAEADRPPFPPLEVTWLEVFCISLIVLYAGNWWWGKDVNYEIARLWITQNKTVLLENFETVGEEAGALVVQEGQSVFHCYATGRRSVDYMETFLELKPRQDLLMFWLVDIAMPATDAFTIRVAITQMDTFCIAFLPRKYASSYHKSNRDLKNYTSPRTVNGLKPQIQAFSDTSEAIERLCGAADHIISEINALSDQAIHIHISDDLDTFQGKAMLLVRYHLKDHRQMAISSRVTKLTLVLADVVSSIQLTEKARSAATTMRKQSQKKKAKTAQAEIQEKLFQKRIEKKKEADEEFLKLPPEQQRKLEEKNARKEARKKTPGVKVVKS